MDRIELGELWADMWKEGNWIPSWPDSLADLSASEACWSPDSKCHSAWQEVAHVIFWRNATLKIMAGGRSPSSEEVERLEFALPEVHDDVNWNAAVDELKRTHDEIAAAIDDESRDVSRVTYHLIHDSYHLGRITQLRAMRGTPPKF